MSRFIVCFCLCALMSCKDNQSPSAPSGPSIDLSTYKVDERGEITIAYKENASGQVVEKGYVRNGQKNGPWITYHDDTEHPKSITIYLNGLVTGPALEIDRRGAITAYDEYLNNRLHGLSAKFKKGFPEITTQYVQGKKEGKSKTFYNYSTDIQKEVDYKNDQIHGKFSQYNEEGELILNYEYKNGQKVSGGTTEK